jgi:predicted enzyme related to lactoylglutathione lyase
MARATALDSVFNSNLARAIPTAKTVPSLHGALSMIGRLGGSIASEIRTAPGIGSWALVVDAAGNELVLWENAAPA